MSVKKKTYRDEGYLAWVRGQPCCISGNPVEVVPHHVRKGMGGGMGLKPSDYRTIPLSPRLHSELHNTGESRFFKEYHLNAEMVICRLLTTRIKELGSEHVRHLICLMELLVDEHGR